MSLPRPAPTRPRARPRRWSLNPPASQLASLPELPEPLPFPSSSTRASTSSPPFPTPTCPRPRTRTRTLSTSSGSAAAPSASSSSSSLSRKSVRWADRDVVFEWRSEGGEGRERTLSEGKAEEAFWRLKSALGGRGAAERARAMEEEEGRKAEEERERRKGGRWWWARLARRGR